MSTAAPTVRGVDHLAIKVSDLDRSQVFYERVLGAKTWGQTEHLRFLDLGFTDFTLEAADKVVARGGVDHLGCSVETEVELEQWFAWLREQGVDAHRQSRSDAEAVWFEDPDGHRFELMWNRPRV